MTRLNRKVEYALMALKVMSQKRQGELTSAKEVVDLTGCPFDATARVLQLLAQKGVLKSEQGAHGGYLLVRDLNRVSTHDLMEWIVGPLGVAKCMQHQSDCELASTCNILSPMAVMNRKLTGFYQNLMVGELLNAKDSTPKALQVSQ